MPEIVEPDNMNPMRHRLLQPTLTALSKAPKKSMTYATLRANIASAAPTERELSTLLNQLKHREMVTFPDGPLQDDTVIALFSTPV